MKNYLKLSLILSVVVLAGCVGPTTTNTNDQNSNTTDTSNKNQNTNDEANANDNTNTTTDVSTAISSKTTNLYFIALEDNGKSGKTIGCGDSVVPVDVQLDSAPTSAEERIKLTLTQLLNNKNKDYGQSGLYNALYQSDVAIQEVTVTDGRAEVKLTGDFTLSGTCDTPRVESQLEEPVLAVEGVESVDITVNGKALSEVLSSK